MPTARPDRPLKRKACRCHTPHGHKTSARGFDGYKGHVAADQDSEITTATAVTPGNSADAESAEGLLAELLAGDQGIGSTADEDQAASARD